MDIRKLQRAIVDGLEDVKGQNISVFNTEHLSPLFERVIIASGTSNRQTRALAASVRDAVKSRGLATPRVEGEDNGEWIIVDCGAAVVHLMQPSIREYYRLEEIWGDKPVKMKIDSTPVRLVKASAAEKPVAARKAAAKKAAAKKVPAAKTAAAKSVAKPVPAKKAVASKTAAKRPAAKRAAPVKTGITRTVGVKTPVAKKATIKTPVMVVAQTKKVVAKQAAAKKAPARKKVATKKVGSRV